MTVERQPSGTLGPHALAHFARQVGVIDLAAPIDTFYPVHPLRVRLLVDPDLRLEDLVTSRTLCVHLYHQMLKPFLA